MATQNNKGNVITSQPSLRGGTTKQSHDINDNNKQIAFTSFLATGSSLAMTHARVPKLRFKEFEGEWEEKRYGEIYSFYTTNSFSRDNLNYEKGIVKNIHYGDIHTKFSTLFDINKELVPFINEEVDLSRIKDENYCQEGDLVIADASEDYNDVGKTIELINLNDEKILAGLHTFLARPNKYNMQIGFSGYLVQSWKVRKQIMTIAQGTKVLGIATGRLSKIKLDIPLLKEQQKIANFLTAVDTKLQQLTTKKETLALYKKGVMQQLFPSTSSGQVPQLRFKDDDGKQFPDWKEKRLGEVTKYIKGFAFKSSDYKTTGVRIVRVSDLDQNRIKTDNDKVFISTEKALEFGKYKLNSGNIIITTVGSKPEMLESAVGRGIYINKNNEGLLNQNMLKFENIEGVDNKFIIGLINTRRYQHYMKGIARGNANQANITVVDLLAYKVSIPSLKEQQKIATYLSAIDQKIEAVQTQITQTQAFKKGLLQQMFV